MFREIETEFMSMVSQDPIERITHIPPVEIVKVMDLLYNIKSDYVERVYSENMGNIIRTVVIYQYTDTNKEPELYSDLIPINGKMHMILLYPSVLLGTEESNAIQISRSLIYYISRRVSLIYSQYSDISNIINKNTFNLIKVQILPVLLCAIMRKLYNGPTLAKLIYMSLCEKLEVYKSMSSEKGINSILNLFDEGLGIEELLDNGFICTIKVDDERYPGIWGHREVKEETKKEESND